MTTGDAIPQTLPDDQLMSLPIGPTRLGRIESGEATEEELLWALDAMSCCRQRINEWNSRLEQAAVEWINATGREPTIRREDGTEVRYYAGARKTTKARDQAAVLTALLEATGGDLGRVAEHLASGAWKPGACGKTLPPERMDELFETKVAQELCEGKPRVRLNRIDTRFTPKGDQHGDHCESER